MAADLIYFRVVQRLGVTVGDTAGDPDLNPDFVTEGTVTIVPSVAYVKAVVDGEPTTVYNAPIVCTVDSSGYLTHNGNRGVWLVDLASNVTPAVPRDQAAYTANYAGLSYADKSITAKPVSFNTSDGAEVDLTVAAPLPLPSGMTLSQVQEIAADAIAAQQAAEAAAASVRPLLSQLASDKVVSNTNDLTDGNAAAVSTDLALPVTPGTYRLDGYLVYSSSTTADANIKFVSPPGTVMGWTCDSPITNTTSPHTLVIRTALVAGSEGVMGGVGGNVVARPCGVVTVVEPGELRLRFAQSTAEVSNTILRAGSWLTLTQT